MELMYPFIIYASIPIILILLFLKIKKKNIPYSKGKKVANTKYIKKLEYYKERIKKYKALINLLKIVCVICIVISIIMIARPVKVETDESIQYNRDIFLCMDASMSVNELNEKLVENFKDIVRKLQEERFGITIFNTSSTLLVPLTDDYDSVCDVLDTLKKSFNANNSYTTQSDLYIKNYIFCGTLVGNEQRGSSLIGTGLASCIYNFPNLEEDRTRIIIFSTDNDLAGDEIVTLEKAAQLAKNKNITIYAVAPASITNDNKNKLQKATETTGGKLYIEENTNTVQSIVSNIEEQEKKLIKGKKETKKTDKPQIPFVTLLISFLALIILEKKVNL